MGFLSVIRRRALRDKMPIREIARRTGLATLGKNAPGGLCGKHTMVETVALGLQAGSETQRLAEILSVRAVNPIVRDRAVEALDEQAAKAATSKKVTADHEQCRAITSNVALQSGRAGAGWRPPVASALLSDPWCCPSAPGWRLHDDADALRHEPRRVCRSRRTLPPAVRPAQEGGRDSLRYWAFGTRQLALPEIFRRFL